jgi:hypothetical protein
MSTTDDMHARVSARLSMARVLIEYNEVLVGVGER